MSHKLNLSERKAENEAWRERLRAQRVAAIRIKRDQDAALNAGLVDQGLYPVRLQTLDEEFDALTRARAYSGAVVKGHAPAAKPAFLRVVS